MLECLTVEEARKARGMRLVVTAGWGNPWVESAKGIFRVKGIAATYVSQYPDVEALTEWTGQASAPAAVYNDEKARTGWAEILHLAERIGAGPALIPAAETDRIVMFGIGNELCGEDGFGWNRRLMMFRDADRNLPADDVQSRETVAALKLKYAYTDAAAARSTTRCGQIVGGLSALLATQADRGSPYLVGDRLSAADIWWAIFSLMLDPIPDADCPLPGPARIQWKVNDAEVLDRVAPALIAHRDFVLRDHIGLPLEF